MKKKWKWIVLFTGTLVSVLLFHAFLFKPYTIPSSGMENTLFQGDRILVNKWGYGFRVPRVFGTSYRRWKPKLARVGDLVVFNNPVSSEKIVNKRKTFISRCIGLPGDTLLLDSLFTVITNWEKIGPDRKQLYAYHCDREAEMDSLLNLLAIRNTSLFGRDCCENVRSFSHYEYYLLSQALGKNNWIIPLQIDGSEIVHQLVIPKAGEEVEITSWNRMLYLNTILLHEGKSAGVRNDTLFVDGKAINSYTFSKNYYWMVSNNSINMADSRLFGFVPEDHLIGKAVYTWFSKEPDTGFFDGYRWKRMFKLIR